MTAEVIEANIVTSLDIPVERVLRRAAEADLESVIVIGWDKDGGEYFASSKSDGADALWLLERTKLKLLQIDDE